MSFASMRGDANFDGQVDHLDLNIVGLNWLNDSATICQGDFSGDQFVGAADDDVVSINWDDPTDYAASVISHAVPSPLDAWRDANGVVFAETEHFELLSIPQSAPDGLLATVLAVPSVPLPPPGNLTDSLTTRRLPQS